MKLKRLITNNFRSIAHSEMEFGEVTVLAGPQGSGKSSHLHAICACLTGRTPHTDRRGAGIKTQIRRDQGRADVELTCAFSTQEATIKRTITDAGQNLEVPFGGKNSTARQVLLTERMGGVDEVPDVLLDPRLFADRDEKEQTQALLKLLRPPAIEVPASARAVGIQSLASIQQVDDQIKGIKEGSVRSLNAVIKNLEETIPVEPTPEELTAAHQAEDDLAQLDARIQDLALAVQNAQFLLEDARKHAAEVEAAKIIVAELPLLRTQQEELHVDAERARGLATKLETLRSDLLHATQARQKMELVKTAQAKLPDLRTAMEKVTAELQDCTLKYKAFEQDYQDGYAKALSTSNKAESLRVTIQRVGLIDGQCPTCARKMSAKAKADVVALLTSELAREEADWKGYNESCEAIIKTRDEQASRGQAARKELERLRQEIARAEVDAQHADLQSASIDDIQSAILGCEESMGELLIKYNASVGLELTLRRAGDLLAGKIADAERAEKLLASPAPDMEKFECTLNDATVDHADAKSRREGVVNAAQAGRDTLRRHADYLRMAAELTTHRTKREAYTMALESLLKLKDSILGGEAARKLQFDCTDIFQKFFPQAHVILSPEGASISPLGTKEGTPVAHLSSGQKVVFDAALRIAAARSTGFNLLAIDDANKLAPSAREALLKVLMSSGCQVIMCTTADNVGKIPNAVVYRISNPGVWGPTKVERITDAKTISG